MRGARLSPQRQTTCPTPGGSPVEISGHAIGGLPLDSPLAVLWRGCPAAHVAHGYRWVLTDASSTELVFPFLGAEASAMQPGDSLHPERPASMWYVIGATAVLPGGVPATAPFAELRRAAGEGWGSVEPDVVVEFCAMPGLLFLFDASAVSLSERHWWLLRTVPDSALDRVMRLDARPKAVIVTPGRGKRCGTRTGSTRPARPPLPPDHRWVAL